MYFAMVAGIGFVSGYITNKVLPDFTPVLDFDRTSNTIKQVNKLLVEVPEWGELLCSFIVIGYAVYALFKFVRGKLKKAQSYEKR